MKEIIVKTGLVGALLVSSSLAIHDKAINDSKVEQLQKKYNHIKEDKRTLKNDLDTETILKNAADADNERLKFELKLKEQKIKELMKANKHVKKNEKKPNIKKVVYAVVTAYISKGSNGITKTGIDVRNSITYKGCRIIAVDPSFIPLHSFVKVYPKDRAAFYAYTEDTGGFIKGNKVDFLISLNNVNEAIKFGLQRDVKIEIIKFGR